ncbi:MAG: hypothetical protein V1929_07585 [bacterium]
MISRRLCALMAVGGAFFCAAGAHADISWFNTSTNRVYYQDAVTALFGYKGSNEISCFVQLLDAGTNGVPDQALNSGQGNFVDDTVVAWSYIGVNVPGTPGSTSAYGRVVAPTFTNEVPGDVYYVRVWTAPSPDYSLGLVPLDGTNYYGDSAVFTANPGFEPPNPPENFNFGGDGGFATTLQAIPEPGTLALGLTAIACAWLRRRLHSPP